MTPQIGTRLQKWVSAITDDAADFTNISADIESLTQGSAFPCLEHYLPYVYDRPASLLDYAPGNALILIEDPHFLEKTAQEIADTAARNRADALSSAQIAAEHPVPYLPWDKLKAALDGLARVELSTCPLVKRRAYSNRASVSAGNCAQC